MHCCAGVLCTPLKASGKWTQPHFSDWSGHDYCSSRNNNLRHKLGSDPVSVVNAEYSVLRPRNGVYW